MAAIYEGEIVMGGGHMSVAQLEAMLNIANRDYICR